MIHPLEWDFLYHKSSSYWGTPILGIPHMEMGAKHGIHVWWSSIPIGILRVGINPYGLLTPKMGTFTIQMMEDHWSRSNGQMFAKILNFCFLQWTCYPCLVYLLTHFSIGYGYGLDSWANLVKLTKCWRPRKMHFGDWRDPVSIGNICKQNDILPVQSHWCRLGTNLAVARYLS